MSEDQTRNYNTDVSVSETVEQPTTGLEEALLRRWKRIDIREEPANNKLPDTVRLMIKNALSNQLNNIKVAEKDSIQLPCNTEFTLSIRARYPFTKYIWSHNGRWVYPDGVKYALTNGDLLINNITQTSDQGVYVCQLFSGKKWRITMAIFALTVSPSATVYRVFAGSNLEVFCNSQTLGQLYHGSTRTWSINGSVVANLTGIDAQLDSTDRVFNVQQNQSGVWTCSVTSADNPNKYWQTNQIVVQICPTPAWWRSMMHQFPLPIVAESFGFTLFLFSLFLCAVATMKKIKQDSNT